MRPNEAQGNLYVIPITKIDPNHPGHSPNHNPNILLLPKYRIWRFRIIIQQGRVSPFKGGCQVNGAAPDFWVEKVGY